MGVVRTAALAASAAIAWASAPAANIACTGTRTSSKVFCPASDRPRALTDSIALSVAPTRSERVGATDKAIESVKARGRSEAGQKTLLDVLVPVQAIFAAGADAQAIAAEAANAAERTTPMLATRGRASFLGERSVGHMDPGSRSASLLIGAAVATLTIEAGL